MEFLFRWALCLIDHEVARIPEGYRVMIVAAVVAAFFV